VAVAVLVVLVAGAIGTYAWALTHWFVSVEAGGSSENVAVFRGLDVSIVGFDFYKLDNRTGLPLSDLTPAARTRVRGGITAASRNDADRILAALRNQRLPVCPTPADSSAATPATTTAPTPPVAGETPSPPGAPVPTAAEPAPTSAPPTDGSTPTTSARTTQSSEPGVDCREMK
jgi:protein phosphatase